MSRFTPNSSGINDGHLAPGVGRPPLDQLPTDLAALLAERDTALERFGAAQQQLSHLSQPERDAEAKRTDDENDAAAARAGKKIPPASAARKLVADRDQAEREVQAHRAALAAVTNDVSTVLTANPDAAEKKAAARDRIAKLAEALADEVEKAVAESAVDDWLAGKGYFVRAETWPVDVDPTLSNHSLDRFNTNHHPVRDYIITAATTVLED